MSSAATEIHANPAKSRSSFFRKVNYYSAFSVIRWPFLLALGFGYLAFGYLQETYYSPGIDNRFDVSTRFEFVMRHWGYVLLWFFIWIIIFALFVNLVAWAWFLLNHSRIKSQLQLEFGKGRQAVAGNVLAAIGVPGIIRPLFGVVKTRIEFEGMTVSSEIVLNDNMRAKGKFWRTGISGRRFLPLKDRREYHITEIQFFFQDMFRMLSLPALVPVSRSMYTVPPQMPLREVKADPNKTEEQDIRIPTPKRIEGEYVNYKDFEPGDDVRRIVWKIYARTRQLVVRIPEVTDPYASHIYLYASFYHGFPQGRREAFDAELLNLYKDQVRNLYESLLPSGLEVRVIPDQDASTNFSVEESEKPIYYISTADWQNQRDLKQFVDKKNAGVVCISSLVPVADVEQMLMDLPSNVTLILVRVSDVFRKHRILKFRDLFFQHKTSDMDGVKRAWLISGFRRRIIKNEKQLSTLIKKMNATGMTV